MEGNVLVEIRGQVEGNLLVEIRVEVSGRKFAGCNSGGRKWKETCWLQFG